MESPINMMVVLGSGGHTAEMLALTRQLDQGRFRPRCYVVAATDALGPIKAAASEQIQADAEDSVRLWSVRTLPRSREVGQSYVTSVWSTIRATGAAIKVVFEETPQVVLVNGPGTCIPICVAAVLLRLVGRDCKVIYVESIARVTKLSLSGWLLYVSQLADVTFVQWPELQKRYPRSVYAGRVF